MCTLGQAQIMGPQGMETGIQRRLLGMWPHAKALGDSSSALAIPERYCPHEIGRQDDSGVTQLILTRIEGCLEIDPGDLLEENQGLLHLDFEQLATGPVKEKVEWIAEMELAMGAAEHVVQGLHQAI